MRVVCISDTHGKLAALRIPDGDLLVHAGDATKRGTLEELQRFGDELAALRRRFREIVFVPGNHDFICETNPQRSAQILSAATVLSDRAWTVAGTRVYGSPWQPWFCDWAFNFPREDGGAAARTTWAGIPEDVELLITHGPPRGILDRTARGDAVGCPVLRQRLEELPSLRLHVFGHIHEAYGEAAGELRNVRFVNASSCTLRYEPLNAPVVIDI